MLNYLGIFSVLRARLLKLLAISPLTRTHQKDTTTGQTNPPKTKASRARIENDMSFGTSCKWTAFFASILADRLLFLRAHGS